MRVLRPILRWDRRGVVSVELALLANFVLVPVVAGATDGGVLVTSLSRLDQVVQAGLFYAYANNGSVTAANVQTYAAQAYGSSNTTPTVTATLTKYCIVPATGYPASGTPPQPTNNSCSSSGQTIQTYLLVTASVSITLPFTVPWTAQTVTLSVSGQARVL